VLQTLLLGQSRGPSIDSIHTAVHSVLPYSRLDTGHIGTTGRQVHHGYNYVSETGQKSDDRHVGIHSDLQYNHTPQKYK